MGLLDWLRPQAKISPPPRPDGFAGEIVDILREVNAHAGNRWVSQVERRQAPAFAQLLELTPEQQRDAVLVAFEQHREFIEWQRRVRAQTDEVIVHYDEPHRYVGCCSDVASELMRRKLPWDTASMLRLLELVAAEEHLHAGYGPVNPTLRALEQTYDDEPVPAELRAPLERITQRLNDYSTADNRKATVRIAVLLGGESGDGPLGLNRDVWASAIRDYVDQAGDRAAELFVLAARASSRAPTKDIRDATEKLISEHGRDQLGELAGGLLLAAAGAVSVSAAESQMPSEVGDVVRGACWIAQACDTEAAARGLGAIAVYGWAKVRGHGPLSRKAASSAIDALARMPAHGAPQLGRVRALLKQPSAQADCDAAIGRAAEMLGIERSEFEERVVPDFGLTAGERSEQLGEHTADLVLGDDLKGQLRFTDANGKTLKSTPAAVRREHADELAALKAQAKDITTMAGAQRLRLERLLMDQRAWELEAWRARYLDHGLVSVLARRLIWTFTDDAGTRSAIAAGGEVIDSDGTTVSLAPDARVRLWHPAVAEAGTVHAWRRFLEEREITQPFKQAHREVYLLTEAELNTDIYSNRFAAHVLRQHQFAALARGRGWNYALQGAFDSEDEQARLPLPAHKLTAAFWVERPWDSEDWNDSGIFNHVLTDQVRFLDENGDPVPLAEIPPLVFSEVLRDVDLFVGVASIGNDPAWQDGGIDQRYDAYWHDYSFGTLSESAEVRRDVLERLLPKLKIAKVSTLEDRYLIVKGQLRTYRIHLGSGNIQMEPNNQYLCIVPGRGDENPNVFLPFEGDRVLSIILSKAMMLAKDTDIDDPTIVSQIKR